MKSNVKNGKAMLQGNRVTASVLGRESRNNTALTSGKKVNTFYIKAFLLGVIILITGLMSLKAQTKGVWGDPKKACPQKFGETYLGVMWGNEGAPSGVTAQIHITPKSAIHAYYGFAGAENAKNLGEVVNNSPIYGLTYQPRINFRNKNHNMGYYVSIGGGVRTNTYREEIRSRSSENSTSKMTNSNQDGDVLETVIHRNTTSEITYGVGTFFEVHKKYQFFMERNMRFFYNSGGSPEIGAQTTIGARLFIF